MLNYHSLHTELMNASHSNNLFTNSCDHISTNGKVPLHSNINLQHPTIDHFTVVCLVAWPLNESEAGVDLVLIETSLLFICKFLLISMRTASLT